MQVESEELGTCEHELEVKLTSQEEIVDFNNSNFNRCFTSPGAVSVGTVVSCSDHVVVEDLQDVSFYKVFAHVLFQIDPVPGESISDLALFLLLLGH